MTRAWLSPRPTRTWLIAAADATKTAALADAAAVHDRDLALLNTDTGYQSDSAARYADEMLALAQGSDTPWGWEHYAEAAAAAEYASSMATAALTDGTTTINESYAFAQTEADETRTLSVNEATAAFNSATALAAAEYNHVTSHATALADDNYHIAERVPTAVINLVGLDDLEGRAAGDPADFIAALNKNGGSPFSDLGDSFYTAAVDKMFYTPPETDELGYSNSFDRWLGENLIRPAVGDDNLINASDAELFLGTAAFAAIAAVTAVYAVPAAITGAASLGFSGMALLVGKGFAAGAAFATVTDVAQQIDANLKNGDTWYRIDVGQTLNAAVHGGIYGAVTAGIAGPVLSGAAIQYASFCKVVTPIAKFAMRAGGAKAMIDGGVMVYNGDVVSGLLNITVGALGLRAAAQMGSFCFVAGTQVHIESETPWCTTIILVGIAIGGHRLIRRGKCARRSRKQH